MLNSGALSFMLLLSCSTIQAKTICLKLLGELAASQSLYVQCMTNHAVPVEICGSCQLNHGNMKRSYESLINNKNCSETYLESDRINVVSTTNGVLTGLWDKAFCDDCVNNLEVFKKNLLELNDCLANKKVEVCAKCLPQYTNLNTFYKQLETDSHSNICFDIQDAMNRTRLQWSKDLKCCQRVLDFTLFLWSVGLVAVLPILVFYVGVVILTLRRESRHGLLNDQSPELDGPSTSTLITAAVLSTRSPPTDEPQTSVQAKTDRVAQLLYLANDSSDDNDVNSVNTQKNLLNLSDDEDSSDDDEMAAGNNVKPKLK